MNTKKLNITQVINPAVEYNGAVKIIYLDKGKNSSLKVINKKNSGDVGLFTAITRALVGFNVKDFTPSYIMGYFDIAGQNAAFASPITFASTPILYNNDSIAVNANEANMLQYTFMVPATSLTSRTQSISLLRLYNNKQQVCASLVLEDDISTNISSNILIYWKLKFN